MGTQEALTQNTADFSTLARKLLRYLHNRLGFGLWMVTRAEGEDWIVLEAEDHGYGVHSGALFRWTDSFCSRMVQGLGPRIAASSAGIPAYAEAPIGQQVPIGAYIGIPLKWPDDTLFGTLCAIDPHSKPASIESELPLIELIAEMLTAQLSKDLIIADLERSVERARLESETDALTGVYNRRAWDRFLAAEEERCRSYGHPACVLALDLDGLKTVNDTAGHSAGDAMIRKAAEVMRSHLRPVDVVARLGGDEFAVLITQGQARHCEALTTRMRSNFRKTGIAVSIGMSMRSPGSDLMAAWKQADAELYEDKRRRKRLVSEDLAYLAGALMPANSVSPASTEANVRPAQERRAVHRNPQEVR